MEQISQILTALNSSDNAVRSQAEKQVKDMAQQQPQQTLGLLVMGLQAPQLEQQMMSAILIRSHFVSKEEELSKVGPEGEQQMVQAMQEVLQDKNRHISLRKRVGENIVQLLSLKDQQAALLQMAKTLLQEDTLLALFLLENLCEYSFDEDSLKGLSTELLGVFEACLGHADLSIRVGTVKCIGVYLRVVQNEGQVAKFKAAMGLAVQIAVQAVQSAQHQDQAQSLLECLGDIVESHPKLIKTVIEEWADLFLQVAGEKRFEGVLRKACMQNLLQLATYLGKESRNSEHLKNRLVPTLVGVLAESDDYDEAEWLSEVEENVQQNQDLSSMAQDVLSQITSQLGCKFMLTRGIQLLGPLLNTSSSPEQLFSALAGVASMTDDMQTHFKGDLAQLMSLLTPLVHGYASLSLRNQHALLSLLGLLAQEFTPLFQRDFHAVVMPHILQQLSNTQPKIVLMALKALTSFTKDLDEENEECPVDFRLYDKEVLGHYHRLLKGSSCFLIIEEVLGGLSLYATLINQAFSAYYQEFMPLLKELVGRTPSGDQIPQQESIRVLATECMGYLLTAVKDQPALFQSDLVSVMAGLLSLHKSIKEEDDQNLSAIVNVYSNLAAVMGPSFEPYLQEVFPLVVKAASIEVHFSVQDILSGQPQDDNNKVVSANIDLKMLGGQKRLTLNAAAYELKLAGLQCLKNMVEHVKTSLHQGDRIENIMTLCLGLLTNKNEHVTREVKQSAMEVVGGLVGCLPPAAQPVLLQAAFPPVLALLKEEIKLQREQEIINVAECMCALLKDFKAPSPIQAEQSLALVEACAAALKYAQSQKNQVVKKFQVDLGATLDEQDNKEFREEYEEVNDVFQAVMELGGQMLRVFGTQVEAVYINQVAPFYQEILSRGNQATQNEVIYAACLFAELVEFSSEGTLGQLSADVMAKFQSLFQEWPVADIRQTLVFTYGVMAQRKAANDNVAVQQSLQFLKETNKESQTEAYETVVVALFKMALCPGADPTISTQSIASFQAALPLKTSGDEAIAAHTLFVQQVQAQHSAIDLVSAKQTLQNIKDNASVFLQKRLVDQNTVAMIQSL